MRLALLASAAICMNAGAAMAQSTMTSPAPTGAPNAAMSSPSGSPGNMAPAAPKPVYGGQDSMTKTGSANPAPTGSPDAAQVTPPGASPGNMAPNNGGADTAASSSAPMSGGGMSAPKMSSMSHMRKAYGSGSMPSDGDVKMYLHIATDAIKQHNKMRADDALSHAETRMLDRAVPASSGAMADDSPAVTSIEHARQALASGDYATASSDTKMAMQAHHEMMGGSGMSPMGGSGMSPMGGSGMSPMGGSGAMGGPTQ